MKIGVVGCGAVGGYYGARLGRAGHDTHFLARSDYDVIRRSGVEIRSPEGDFHHQPQCSRQPEEIGVCDLVLVALKTTANDQFGPLVAPLVGPTTAVLTLQNGLGNEEQLAALFGQERIFGGLCFVCLNRIAPGVIQHLAHGTIVMGAFNRPPEPRAHELAAALRASGVPCKVAANLAAAHWEKLVWNIPFNGLGVASAAGYEAVTNGRLPAGATVGACLTTDALLADPRWEARVRDLMLEVIDAANRLGLALAPSVADHQIQRTREMGRYQASTLLDFERGQKLELESLFLEPLRQARRAGAEVPLLANLCAVLQELDSPRLPSAAC